MRIALLDHSINATGHKEGEVPPPSALEKRNRPRARAAPGRSVDPIDRSIEANETQGQFEDVCAAFGIEFQPGSFMSRCALCNGQGFDVVDAAEVRGGGAASSRREKNLRREDVSH